MSKKNEDELLKKHIDDAHDIAMSLYDLLEKKLEEHTVINGDILVGVGMFASMILANIFERCEGMTTQMAIKETRRWASIVVSEVSDYFNEKDNKSKK